MTAVATIERGLARKQRQQLVSKDGYSFEREADRWVLNKDRTIAFQSEVLGIDPKVLEGFRSQLARCAQELSADHTSNMYLRLQRFIRDTGSKRITVDSLMNWRVLLGDEREWHLGALRGFLVDWYDNGYHGVGKEVVSYLEGLRLKGNSKGVAVANRCPYTGAFTQNEVLAINQELIRLWREDEIDVTCYAYINLLQATARRSVNLRQLKAMDLMVTRKNGATTYKLNIPRAKVRNGGGFRSEFKTLSITEELYVTHLNLVEQQVAVLEELYNQKLNEEQKQLVPMYLDRNMASQMIGQGALGDLLDSDILHMSSVSLREQYVMTFNRRQRAVSERTGDIIVITARRFRRTRGTNLGRKGYGAAIIAEALDHSDTQNVKVYTENTANTVQYIDKVVGKALAPFANAFMGRIIENLDDGERGDDLTAKIPNTENETVGACGTNDFCVKGYEACYLCEKFRPLLDGPHEKFLENLYREKEERLRNSRSKEFASTKDRLILAVEWVVAKCKEMKASQEETQNG
ncbi:site-specific integrase [uncultured Ferrimonas sp.]|uniref:site-specific integrase n=1 Tax=uncultured Ferrimonas sp. TaxID=432640 RepID=UPI0026038C19|nr:site-specific integrase [uncultured Ferrimonas sp.]